MRSAARRGLNLIRQGVTDFSKLDDTTRQKLFVEQSVLGATMLATSTAGRERIAEAINSSPAGLSIGRTLELLK